MFDAGHIDATPTVEVVCEDERTCDLIVTYHACGQTVHVGPGRPNYFVLAGTPCTFLPGPMVGTGSSR